MNLERIMIKSTETQSMKEGKNLKFIIEKLNIQNICQNIQIFYRYDRTLKGDRRYKNHEDEKRRYNSSDRESDRQSRPSDIESDRRKTRSRTAGPLDSPALVSLFF